MSLTREQRQFIRERRAELTRDSVPFRPDLLQQRRPQLGEDLSRREVQVLIGAADGLTYRETAVRLGIAESTTKQYGEAARIRLGARTIAQAAVLADRRGLLEDVST